MLTSQDHPPSWIDAPLWTGADGMLRFLRHRFQTSPFSPVHEVFSNVSTFETVFGSLGFHWRFSVDDRRKRIKNHAFFKRKRISVDGTLLSEGLRPSLYVALQSNLIPLNSSFRRHKSWRGFMRRN